MVFPLSPGQLIMDVLHETRVVQLNKMLGLQTSARPSSQEVTSTAPIPIKGIHVSFSVTA